MDSRFPSGQRSERDLLRNLKRDVPRSSLRVTKDGRTLWVLKDQVLRDFDLSRWVIRKSNRESFEILDISGPFLKCRQRETGLLEYIHWKDLESDSKDFGYAINLVPSSIHKSPDWSSAALINLAARTRLEVIAFKDNWAQVKFSDQASVVGFVELGSLALKSDFAQQIQTRSGSWLGVSHREGAEVVSPGGQRTSLSDIIAAKTDSSRGLIAQNLPLQKLSLRNLVHVDQVEAESWKISFLSGHGEVYWRAPEIKDSLPNENEDENSAHAKSLVKFSGDRLSTESLVDREIHSVSFHPKNQKLGLVSSEGVFFTKDGLVWNRLLQFKNQNHPVLIGSRGELIVGHLWSLDEGKTFKPYLRFEHLLALLDPSLQKSAPSLELESLHQSGDREIRISLNTGTKKFAVLGHPERANWKIRN